MAGEVSAAAPVGPVAMGEAADGVVAADADATGSGPSRRSEFGAALGESATRVSLGRCWSEGADPDNGVSGTATTFRLPDGPSPPPCASRARPEPNLTGPLAASSVDRAAREVALGPAGPERGALETAESAEADAPSESRGAASATPRLRPPTTKPIPSAAARPPTLPTDADATAPGLSSPIVAVRIINFPLCRSHS